MKTLATLLFCLQSILTLHAQQFDFAKQFSGTNYTQCRAMARDAAGNLAITGHFRGTVDMDPTAAVLSVTTNGENDAFIVKMDAAGNVLWHKTFGGPEHELPYDVCFDPAGNVIVVGSFMETVDLDPGPDEHMVTTVGEDDIFVVKLSADGDFVWGAAAGGSAVDMAYTVTSDNDGNIVVGGFFRNTADFNPGAGTGELTAFDFPDAFVWKLSSVGAYLWAKSFSGSAEDLVADIAIDDTGRITAAGTFYETTDFDPTAAAFNLSSFGAADIYIAQLEANGDFVYAKRIGGFGYDVVDAITIGDDGALYFTGYYQLTVDFDPDAGTDQLTAQGPYDTFVSKWNNDGSYAWAKGFRGGGFMNQGNAITLDAQNNVLTTGYYSASTDFDPNEGIAQLGNAGGTDIFISKLNNDGNFIWAYGLGAAGEDWGNGIATDNNGGIYVAGYFDETIDFDPSAGTYNMTAQGFADSFVMKISEDECSNLSLSIVSAHSSDCIDFHGEATASASGGTEPYAYEWLDIDPIDDTTIMPMDEGIYYVTVTDGIGCERTTGAFVNGYDNPSYYNLEAYIAEGELRPEINSRVNIIAYNHGCQPVDATVKLLLTPACTYLSSEPPATQIVGDTVMWSLPQINWDSEHFMAKVKMIPDPGLPLYDSLCFQVFITPTEADFDISDNEDGMCYFFRFSYDPNDKQVSPLGACEERYTLHGEELHYNVRFQNIGNAPAENVYILDTLSQSLDLNSFRVLASSHEMVTEILPGNVIKYRFDNINLPDSTSDFEGSQGFVFFSIDPLSNLPEHTAVRNSAAIYFDQNDPVITNQTLNTYVSTIPVCTSSVNESPANTSSILLYPNPTNGMLNLHVEEELSELKIYNRFGQLVYRTGKTRETDIKINTASFASGVYFMQVSFGDFIKTMKFVVAGE